MAKDKFNKRKGVQFNTADKQRLINQGRHLPVVGAKTFKDLPKAYIDHITHPANKPWKITLWVRDDEHKATFRPVTYFARGKDPTQAIAVAERFWYEIEKKGKGLDGQRYPDVLGRGHATCLDEQDWAEYLEDSKKFGTKRGLKMHIKGEPIHPIMFTTPGLVFDLEASQAPSEEDFQNSNTVHKLG